MPAPNLPSSFASAAAGQTSSRDRGNGRAEGRGSGSGEWTRREGRPNGTATLTLRRSSTTPFNQNSMQASIDNTLPTPVNETPTSALPQSAGTMDSPSTRYSREQLLEWSKSDETRETDVSSLIMASFNAGHVNGNSTRSWGKATDSHGHGHQDPTSCWESNGNLAPLGLREMSQEEKELFTSDVNSPIKLPQNKDGGQGGGLNGRKPSVSHAHGGGNYGLASPVSASRPAARRRETTDTNPFPSSSAVASPTGAGPASRFDQSSWLNRRTTDTREEVEEPEEEHPTTREPPKLSGFGNLVRSNTSGTGSGFGASTWATSSPAPSIPGIGAFGNFALPTSGATIDNKGFGTSQGGSRLAHLMPKESSENVGGARANDGASANTNAAQSWRARPRTDTDPFADGVVPSGSAALGGARDTSPPPMMNQPHGAQIYDTPAKGNTADFGMSGLDLGASRDGNGSASPSQTNPYRSPPAERGDNEHEDLGFERQHHLGNHSEQASHFGSIGRGFPTNVLDGSDRSQTSSVGAKAYPSLGNISGWPTGLSTATPDRERAGFNAFGNSLFSPTIGGDLPSPGLANLGGLFGPASASGFGAGTGSLRGSKLGSLFPAEMQARMQNQDQESLSDSVPDMRQVNHLGAIGRGPMTLPRDTDSPLRNTRGGFEDMFPSSQAVNSPGLFTAAEPNQPTPTTASQGRAFAATTAGSSFTALQTPTELHSLQSRTMVMPDRMRWVYLDPQGQVQGPFTGLEMNDWYKAQFFSADLRVRKLEDTEFEPLGQLIRRIGNSREPFLVPQIGIAHGPPSQTGPFSPGGDARGGGVIPPLMGVVPSFGRTLTADEQNNLERRKQEEQYLMARQREFMAAANHKLHVGPGGALHHHSSAQSLQSQPSFGSMTSPIGNISSQPQPIGAMGPSAGFFEQPPNNASQGPGLPEAFRGEASEQDRQQMMASMNGPSGISGMFPLQPVGAPSPDPRSQLPSVDQLQNDSQGFKDRLKEFQEIRATRDAAAAQSGHLRTGPVEEQAKDAVDTAQSRAAEVMNEMAKEAALRQEAKKVLEQQQQQLQQQQLSLTQQVQKAQEMAEEKQKEQDAEAWTKIGLPMPFPPPAPSSNTPLPAPTPRRAGTKIADEYGMVRSQSATPDSAAADSATAAPPTLAPWAREPGTETQKVLSLKEIQEAEARKAAKQEAARRVAMEQEAILAKEREKVAPVVPGLPTSSTWGSGSPAPAANSPWAKPPVAKTPGLLTGSPGFATSANEKKKTLAEIQREEESRKMKAAKEQGVQTTAAAAQAGPSFGLGKRYADLASKVGVSSAAPPAAMTVGWATVGAGGKVKVPTGPAAQTRPISATNIKAPAASVVKPAAAAVVKDTSASDARAEFKKWVHEELAKGVPGGPEIVQAVSSTLFAMPLDEKLIAEIIYGHTTIQDGNHFSSEFIRRKKLAEKGIIEKRPAPANDIKTGGGADEWSQVAKKGGNSAAATQQGKDNEPVANFKVVPSRKNKGSKK